MHIRQQSLFTESISIVICFKAGKYYIRGRRANKLHVSCVPSDDNLLFEMNYN